MTPFARSDRSDWSVLRERLAALNLAERELIFVRHGQSVANRDGQIAGVRDTRLTDRGRQQASALRHLIPTPLALAFSSDLSRAIETAKLALAGRGIVQVQRDPRLREVAQGDLEGQKRRPIAAYAAGDIDYAPTGGESYRSAALRLASFLVDLAEKADRQPGGAFAIFTHAGVVRIATCLFTQDAHPTGLFAATPKNGELYVAPLQALTIHPAW